MEERVEKWDNFKGLLIVLVVLGHLLDRAITKGPILDRLDYWIYLFHMPAFLFVTGMFSKHNIQGRRYRKIELFLIYYVVLKVIFFVTQLLAYWPNIPKFSFVVEGNVPWYFLAVFVYEIVVIALDKFNQRFSVALVIIIGLVSGYDPNLGDNFALARITAFMPFFYLGYLADSKQLVRITKLKWARILSAVIVAISAAGVFLLYDHIHGLWDLLIGRHDYANMGQTVLRYGAFLRGGYYVVVLVLIFALFTIIPSSRSGMALLGRKTIQIYAFHISVITALYVGLHAQTQLMGFLHSEVLLATIMTIIVVAVCLLPPITWLSEKIFPR